MNVRYQLRNGRQGYKAGALKEGMKQPYIKDCEYIAMFDADFAPESDFLTRSIPYLVHNPQLALVQGRWKFGIQNFRFYISRSVQGRVFHLIFYDELQQMQMSA